MKQEISFLISSINGYYGVEVATNKHSLRDLWKMRREIEEAEHRKPNKGRPQNGEQRSSYEGRQYCGGKLPYTREV